MYRKAIHRGIAALALVTVLTVAGASPAAAASHQGAPGRLAGAWSAATEGASSFLDLLVHWLGGGVPARTPRARTMTKLGWGIDPNGGWIVAQPEPGPADPGSHNG